MKSRNAPSIGRMRITKKYSKQEQCRITKYVKYRQQYSRVSNHKIPQVQAVFSVVNPQILDVQAASRVLPPDIHEVEVAISTSIGPRNTRSTSRIQVSIGPQNTFTEGRIRSIEPKESQNAQFKHHLLPSKAGVPAKLPSLLLIILPGTCYGVLLFIPCTEGVRC